MIHPHDLTVHTCMELFNLEHGVNHDVFIHSTITFTKLRATLFDPFLFEYDNASYHYRDSNNISNTFVKDDYMSMCKDIIYDVEGHVMNQIYKQIQDSDNPRLIRRLHKLKSRIIDYNEYLDDNDVMRILLKYALSKSKLTSNDYFEFGTIVKTILDAEKSMETMNAHLTLDIAKACVLLGISG